MMDRSLEGRDKPAGYRMIDRLVLKNFRCFEALELNQLPRFNIVVGENASGKTALLESLFFGGAGSPDLAFRLRAWRGAEQVIQLNRTKGSYESLWRELFFNQDQQRRIYARVYGSEGNNYEIEVFYGGQQALTIPLNGEGLAQDSPVLRLITFKGVDAQGKPFDMQPDINSAGLNLGIPGIQTQTSFFSSTMQPASGETAQRFSDLRKEQKHKRLVEAIVKEFPVISDLDIEIEAGAHMIFATVVGMQRKLRLGMVSGGLTKLVSVLIGIQSNTKGVVLIDEIENGIHYSKLPNLWSLVYDFASVSETQIFASTHSWECLKAAQSMIEKHPSEFGLLRTEFANGKHTVAQFSGAQVLGALKQNGEVR